MKIHIGPLWAHAAQRSDAERAFMADYLSYEETRFVKAGGRTKRVQPKVHRLYSIINDNFPSGMVPQSASAAREEGFEVEVIDKRTPPCDVVALRRAIASGASALRTAAKAQGLSDLEGLAQDIPGLRDVLDAVPAGWLRAYQFEAVARVLARTSGILWMPTGSGKTEVAVALAKVTGARWLFLVHRKGLMSQAAERYELRTGDIAGRIGEGNWDEQRFTVATFQTIARALSSKDAETRRKARDLCTGVQGIIVDECFPAGVRVGGTPIERVRVGDMVPSYDTDTGEFCRRAVVKVWARTVRALVRLHFADGGVLVCTPGHPLLTQTGWAPAKSLCGQRVLRSVHGVFKKEGSMRGVWGHAPPHNDSGIAHLLLRGVQTQAQTTTAQGGDVAMCDVQFTHGIKRQVGSRTCEAAPHVLFEHLSQQSAVAVIDAHGFSKRCSVERSHEGEKPNACRRNSKEGKCHPTQDRPPTACAGGQWKGPHGTSSKPLGGSAKSRLGVGGGVSCTHAQSARTTKLHSDRHSPPCAPSSLGSRRQQSLFHQSAGEGPAQRVVSAWRRVVGVEVLEPGSDGTFGGMCEGGVVYNLQVDGTETYLADGMVAHNCHVLPAESFWSVAMACSRAHWRVGMSGTPLARGDKRSLLAVAATGPIIYRLRADVLVEAGVLAKPEIHLLPLTQESVKTTWQGVYGECIVRSARRNKLLVDAAQRAQKPCLVFVKELKHGKELVARLSKAGLNVDFAHGKHSVGWRDNMVDGLKRGALDVLVCTVIFQEGTDIPCLESVVIGSGGKSAIAALQRIGRGMRNDQGRKQTFEVYDVLDQGNKWLERHAKERQRAYQTEGFEIQHS